MKNKTLFLLIFSLFINAGFAQSKLLVGIWRGVLTNSAGKSLPFNFMVTDTAGKQILTVMNGDERLKVTDIKIIGDSVFIKMPLFDSEFRLKIEENKLALGNDLTGKWIKHLGVSDARMDFVAQQGINWRFFGATVISNDGEIRNSIGSDGKVHPLPDLPKSQPVNVTGRWTAIFGDGDGRDTTVGEFKQTGSHVTGTFLTTSGDYRYLEGSVVGDSLYLSTFDGGHAFIFTAKVDGQSMADGKFYSGYSGLDHWTAVRNKNAKLPDAYSLTYLKPGFKTIAFTFKDLNGNSVSLSDPQFKNKVIIIQIMGSWCPNCMDETAFITGGYYQKYHPKGLEVIGLAYERTTDFSKSQHTLQQLKDHFNITYPLLITGYTPGRGDPQKSLPMLADFKGFPTTIIIDKSGNVRKIHTGFSGPGTGDYYTQFVNEFERLTDDLLAE